jgi:hypothetical protein
MSFDEWEKQLATLVNAAMLASPECDESDRELIQQELRSGIRALCELMRSGVVQLPYQSEVPRPSHKCG